MNYRLTELKVLLFLLLLSAVSCQRPMYDEEDDEDGVSQTNLPLKISARSSGESQINYLCVCRGRQLFCQSENDR